MAERTLMDVLREFKGRPIGLVTTSGERVRGVLADVGLDYIIIQREQMVPLVVSMRAIETFS